MSLYIFDTDTLSLFERMQPGVLFGVFEHLGDELAITTVTIEEQFGGWFGQLRKATTPDRIEAVSRRLADAVRHLALWDVLPQTVASVTRYQSLLRMKLNVGGNDLRIASVALELGATVVTRNVRDFGRVPGLPVEDWAANSDSALG